VQFWLAWTCGLGPKAIADLSGPIAIARHLVEKSPKNADDRAALGMLLYRAGKYGEAEKQFAEAINAYTAGWPEGSVAHAQYFVAMLQWQRGSKEEANRSYTKGTQLHMEVTKSMGDWNRRATLELFRREAETLIQPTIGSVEKSK
jgi:tetratricopeptide (TPR) repeat protein